ncbi:MAG: ergothioneine biosynthesis protein EgtB [Leptolyngbya sp.]|nr:MAG: ergothioneine biosynthesis protein EgtB [Leptolyngbya sp.]
MTECRESTLALFKGMDYETLCCQAHPDFSPVGWHLGHIAYTESLWLLERSAGYPSQFPEYHRLFAADVLPKVDRVKLPTLPEIKDYLGTIREQVFAYLAIAPIEQQERLWRWLLQHESQHCETIAIVLAIKAQQETLQFLPLGPCPLPRSAERSRRSLSPYPMIQIPAGTVEMGHDAIAALDNERPIHRVDLETFWIDRYPVTCEQYRLFMQADGYQTAAYWSVEGWQWLQQHLVTQPFYWSNHSTYDLHPVCGVSWYEAEAYANFVGKRLPTEAEWEKAAAWKSAAQLPLSFPWGNEPPSPLLCNYGHKVGQTTPVNAYPQGASPFGCYDTIGNVWEWTSSWFRGYPDFASYPYHGYSQTYFDDQHRVLRGGSWATRSWALRNTFRNWYYPHVREIFAGFRCAQNSH